MPGKKGYSRKYKKRTSKPVKTITKQVVLSKPMQKAIAKVAVKANTKRIETKVINCPDSSSGLIPTNTINRSYLAAQGLMYLVQDVYRQPIGPNDSTALPNPGNRLGDSVQGVGFEMDYYIHLARGYQLSGLKLNIPFVKMRMLVFTTHPMISPPTYGTLFDTNFVNSNTYTLQPLAWREGFIKNKLYDDVIILRPDDMLGVDSVSDPNTQQAYSNVYHFKKYFEYKKKIKYMDESITDPTGTNEPIHIALTAEIDDSWSQGGFPPSDTPLLYITGFTRAWFKDA